MNNKLYESAFKGYIKDKSAYSEVECFLNYVKEDKNDFSKMVRPCLLVVSEDESKSRLVSEAVTNLLLQEEFVTRPIKRPSYLWANPIDDHVDCVVVNDYDENNATSQDWNRIIKRLSKDKQNGELEQSNRISIFLTTPKRAHDYEKFDKEEYYRLFSNRIVLEPFTVTEIMDGAHYYFEECKKMGEIDYPYNFFLELDRWIDSVYGRADLKGEEFVVGLRNRLHQESKRLGHTDFFDKDSIPFYFRRESKGIILSEIHKDKNFKDNKKIDELFNEVDKHFIEHADKSLYSFKVVSKDKTKAKEFAKYYARILNSNEYKILSSKQVETAQLNELLEYSDFQDKHGVLLVENEKNNEEALKYLQQIVNDNSNDLVCVLYDENTTNYDGLKYELGLDVATNAGFKEVIQKEEKLGELVSKVSDNPKRKNVLLLAMSTLNKLSVNYYKYKTDAKTFEGKYVSQLEPVPKILAEILAESRNLDGNKKKGGFNPQKLDYIYVLNTEETSKEVVKQDTLPLFTNNGSSKDINGEEYTPFTYFKERCQKFINPNHIIGIDSEGNLSNTLYNFVEKLNQLIYSNQSTYEINLYVDVHGGFREINAVTDAMIAMIKDIDHIHLKGMLTANYAYNEKTSEVKSIDEVNKIYDFVGGMHELLSFGRSNGLEHFNAQSNDQNAISLVKSINDISDSIILCRMEKFDRNLNKLSNAVKNGDANHGYYKVIKPLIENNYRVTIQHKTYDLLGDDVNYLPAQIKWCLDKKLLQQALVMIESQTAKSLVDNGILINMVADVDGKYPRFLSWIIHSLCKDYRGRNYWKNRRGNPQMMDAYFDKYEEHFKGINIVHLNKSEVIDRINGKRTNSINNKEFYEYFDETEPYYADLFDASKPYIQYNHNKKYYQKHDIPVCSNILNDDNKLEKLYILLFVYKGLKKYRNTVAHASTRNQPDLPREALEKWIALYIELLDEMLKYSI